MKKLSFVLCFATSSILPVAGIAQPPEANGEAVVVNHIAMYVSNLERSSGFYESVLHLKKIPEPFKDGRHTWFSLGAAGSLHLIQGVNPEEVRYSKYDHLCFSVRSMESFIANLDKLNIPYTNLQGTAKEPTIRPDGVKQIYFRDPDGHWIEINDDRAK